MIAVSLVPYFRLAGGSWHPDAARYVVIATIEKIFFATPRWPIPRDLSAPGGCSISTNSELPSSKSPWPLMLPALVHALIWLIQVVGCAVDSLDGELHYWVCKEPNGLIQIHRHGALDDGNSELLLAAWAPAVIELRRAAAEPAESSSLFLPDGINSVSELARRSAVRMRRAARCRASTLSGISALRTNGGTA